MDWSIPYDRNQFFTGREPLLAVVKKTPIAILIGSGGIGKTEIVLEYAYRYHQEYLAVFWIDASSPPLSEELALLKKAIPQRKKWLLVLDQVEDDLLERIIPDEIGNGHILVTTRFPIPRFPTSTIIVPPFTELEGALFLLRRIGLLGSDESLGQADHMALLHAKALSRLLDCLPINLDLAGSQIDAEQMTLLEYLRQRYSKMGMEMPDTFVSQDFQMRPRDKHLILPGEMVYFVGERAEIWLGRVERWEGSKIVVQLADRQQKWVQEIWSRFYAERYPTSGFFECPEDLKPLLTFRSDTIRE